MREAAVEIRHAVKHYGDFVAVRDLSLRVPIGTVYGLLGPNGAGKTTTIRMILNIIAPDAGMVEVFGTSAALESTRDRIGYLPEERGLYRKMKVRAVLQFLAALKGVGRQQADRRIDEWLDRLSLRSGTEDWGEANVEDLSRGMQQKVQFIGTLLHEPDLVVLDEPFSGLDPINAQALKDAVIELKRRGKTVIFSTHMMDNAERMCDAVGIIARGEKVVDGTVSELRAAAGEGHVAVALASGRAADAASVFEDRRVVARVDDQNRYFEVELVPGVTPQLLLERLVAAGTQIQRFELIQPSLHQIFLRHVGASGIEEGISGQG